MTQEQINIESLIENSIGKMGRYHVWLIFIIFLCKFPIAWHQLGILFLAPKTNVTCIDDTFKDPCDPNCPAHQFDRSTFTDTIVMKWDLVCSREYLKYMVQGFVMFGILIGSITFGYLGDRFGRKYPLVAGIVVECVSACGAAMTPWLPLYLVLQFLTTVGTGGTMVQSFVLLMEIVGANWRAPIGSLYHLPFVFGHLTLPLISYLLRDYKYYQLALGVIPLILVTYICLVPESPRWLIVKGRPEEAIKIMETFARRNKLPVEHIKTDVEAYLTQSTESEQMMKHYHIFHLFQTPVLRTYTLVAAYSWLAVGLCFYGVAQFIGQMGGNVFLNVIYSAAVGIPGVFFSIFSTGYFGRKPTLIFSNLLTAVANISIAPVPESISWARALLGSIAMFGLTVWFITVYIYSGELFPTVTRNIGVGTTSMSARFGSITAPFIIYLDALGIWLPPLVFAVFALIGAVLSIFLPETLNRKMPDSIEETERQGRHLQRINQT